MTIIDQLSTSQADRTQNPNKRLASKIVLANDLAAIEELVSLLQSPPNTDLLADALKVLEMIGEQDESMIIDTYSKVEPLLGHRSNKIQWRAMSVLSLIASFYKKEIYGRLTSLLDLMDSGSVITRDHGVKILIQLYMDEKYKEEISDLLTEQVMIAPDNQLGQYSEKWMAVIDQEDIARLIDVLEKRQPDLANPSHQNRISRVLKKLYKKM